MRLTLNPHARKLLRRVPHPSAYSGAELLLLALLAVQCARLFYAIVTPIGPVGDWRPERSFRPAIQSSAELLGGFDPFFRTAGGAGPAVVTSLDLQLFGVRQDQASGRGSAIIGTKGGEQKSYAVGEEITPGVTLQAVGFDHVTIARNGASEQLYMDQSGSTAPAEIPTSSPSAPSTASPAAPAAANQIRPVH